MANKSETNFLMNDLVGLLLNNSQRNIDYLIFSSGVLRIIYSKQEYFSAFKYLGQQKTNIILDFRFLVSINKFKFRNVKKLLTKSRNVAKIVFVAEVLRRFKFF